jgi:hypothetical protein
MDPYIAQEQYKNGLLPDPPVDNGMLIYVCVYVYFVCVYVCMYIYVYICIFIYIYIYKNFLIHQVIMVCRFYFEIIRISDMWMLA